MLGHGGQVRVLGLGIVVLAESGLGEQEGRQEDRDCDQGDGHSREDGPESRRSGAPEEGDQRHRQGEKCRERDGAVGVHEEHHDGDHEVGEPPILHEHETPVEEPRHEHDRRELGQIPPGEEPVGEGVVGEEEAQGADRAEELIVGDGPEGLAHAVRTDEQEESDRGDHGRLEAQTPPRQQQTGHIEEGAVVVEQHGRPHPERVAAGPHGEEVEVAEVAGVHLDEEQGSSGALH